MHADKTVPAVHDRCFNAAMTSQINNVRTETRKNRYSLRNKNSHLREKC